MRQFLLALIALVAVAPAPAEPPDVEAFITSAPPPGAYVLSRIRTHPVVIFGEAHWVREEVELIRDLAALLPGAGTRTLAVEVFQASNQEVIDQIVSADEWNEDAAMSVLREAGMPHEEYLDIIKAVWKTRRENGNDSLQLLAIGPGHDWRDRLPKGETYDSFMASKVKEVLASRGGSILVYTGLHHAFTRYMQPDTTFNGRARQFMIRMGNLLRWELGERVFVITSHRPIQCGEGDDWGHCEPFGGVIECASSRASRGAFAFDVAGSPFAELRFGSRDLYVAGYPDLRLVDFVDGLVWFAPADQLRQTRLIPLARYAPTKAALDEVSRSNPFDDRTGLSHDELVALWKDQETGRSGPILRTRWKGVGNWRDLCGGTQP